jgi:hypothetical protein
MFQPKFPCHVVKGKSRIQKAIGKSIQLSSYCFCRWAANSSFRNMDPTKGVENHPLQGNEYSSSVSKHSVITKCRGCGGMAQHNLHFGLHKAVLSVLCYSYINLTAKAASAHGKHNGSRVDLDTAAMKRKIPTPNGNWTPDKQPFVVTLLLILFWFH